MSCPIRTEGQEYVCSTCGIRWDFGDEQPECRGTDAALIAAPREEAEAIARRMTARFRTVDEPCTVAALEPSTWRPSPRTELAARLRRVLAMQSGPGQNPIAVAITPNLARDILAELERIP